MRRAPRYLAATAAALASTVLLGVLFGIVARFEAAQGTAEPSSKARALAEAISEGINRSFAVFALTAPAALLVAWRWPRMTRTARVGVAVLLAFGSSLLLCADLAMARLVLHAGDFATAADRQRALASTIAETFYDAVFLAIVMVPVVGALAWRSLAARK